MNLEFIAHRMIEDGWKKDSHNLYAGWNFDMIFSRKFLFEPWKVLIKTIPVLDIFTLNKIKGQLELIFTRSKTNYWQRNFFLYLICDKVTQQSLHALKMDNIGLQRFNQKGSGTRKIMVVDELNRQIHGPFPQQLEFEKPLTFDLKPYFFQAFSPDGAVYPLPPVYDDVKTLIDNLRPTSAMKLIADSSRTDLEVYRIEALGELGRIHEMDEHLDTLLPRLQGDDLARMQRFKARQLFSKGQVDEGIWLLEQAARNVSDQGIRAAIISTKANGYAIKSCFTLAENAIREALQIAPSEPRVLFSQAFLYLQMDQRLEARDILERMNVDQQNWVGSYIDLELANIAILLGEFDEAWRLATSALAYSDEIINPLVLLAGLAMLKNDLPEMERLLSQIEARSPQADVLPPIREDLERLKKYYAGQLKAPYCRLDSFPSLVQRRDHCGPCTIELVMRYWKGGLDLTNNEIANWVKLPHSGTPVHRMTEFFHLLGFSTLRCIAPTQKLKQLVENGFPAIVEVRAAAQSHVTVVIGYDDNAGVIDLQDPMTHQVIPMPVDELNRYRKLMSDSAIVAFPAGKGHEDTLARLGLFPDEVLSLLDQASQAIELGNHAHVANLMERATWIRTQHGISWVYWLQSLLQQWQEAQYQVRAFPAQLNKVVREQILTNMQGIRDKFYSVLEQARLANLQDEILYSLAGQAALLEGDLPRALESFQLSKELCPTNPNTLAEIAECQYGLRQVEQALESAQLAVKLDPGLMSGNIWLSRCLAELKKEHADYYAQIGLELAPNWWLAHLAMAEAQLSIDPARFSQLESSPGNLLNPGMVAWKEIDVVMSHYPNQPDALVLRAFLLQSSRDFISAQTVLESALQTTLNDGKSPIPITIHKINQSLCRLHLSQGRNDLALEQVLKMLELEPGDPWALQFHAYLSNQLFIQATFQAQVNGLVDQEFNPIKELYLTAIKANQGDPGVVNDFLNSLLSLDRKIEAVELAASLRDQFPHQPNLIYQHGWILQSAGQLDTAAGVMLEALEKEHSITNSNQLSFAIWTILDGLGFEKGEQAILQVNLPFNITTRERDRALGLTLTSFPEQMGGRARQLLEAALAENPNDAEAIHRLAYVAQNDDECEQFLRQAVFLAPHWSYARYILANFLVYKDRWQEALQFTTGHELESLNLLEEHVFSLNKTGHYEEALELADLLVNETIPLAERTSLRYRIKFDAENNCGKNEKSLATAIQAQGLFPTELDWFFFQALSLVHLDQFAEANAALVAGQAKGLDEDYVHRVLYRISLAQGDKKTALDIAHQRQADEQKALAEKGGPTVLNLGEWAFRYLELLVHLGRLEEAEKYISHQCKQSHDWATVARRLCPTAAGHLTLKCALEALKGEKLSSDDRIMALFARAIASQNLDDPNALQYFEQLRDEFPRSADIYDQLAIYAILDGDFNRAEILAEQALVYERDSWFSWVVMGLVQFFKGDKPAATGDLEKGIYRNREILNPGPPFHWLFYALSGDQASAAKWKEQAYSQAICTVERQLLELIQSHL